MVTGRRVSFFGLEIFLKISSGDEEGMGIQLGEDGREEAGIRTRRQGRLLWFAVGCFADAVLHWRRLLETGRRGVGMGMRVLRRAAALSARAMVGMGV
jgi:hypothetical protein